VKAKSTTKTSRSNKPTKSKLKAQCDDLWSKVIRQRDGKCAFVHCINDSAQAHHIFGRKNLSTRWDTRNGITLCYYHHKIIAHGEPEFFRRWLIENWFTMNEYNQLYELSRIVTHWKINELLEIKAQLKRQIDG
jgi:hypothetical protein